MSSSLINSAMSGLFAAQAALNTVSNNINNYSVAGFTRQTTVLSQANSTLGAGGWVGNGVNVTGVQREYDAFITNQLRAAQNLSSSLTTRYEQMSEIDNMLSSGANTLSSTLQDFFKTLQALASNAEDPAARQALLGKAEGLVNQFRVTDQYLRDQSKDVNGAISSSVDQINTYARQIANLNDRISRLTGVGASTSPNDLLDKRDQLVSELNKRVGVEVTVQDGGTYNLTVGNGYPLVQGDSANQLAAVALSADPSRITVAFVDKTAGNVEIPEKLLNTGSLGGLLTFRAQDLDSTRNSLNQMALAFADAFNTTHNAGFDASGAQGQDFFSFGNQGLSGVPEAITNAKNSDVKTTLTVSYSATAKVQASDYKITRLNGVWEITRLSDNASITPTATPGGALAFDGLEVAINGAFADSDTFMVKPVGNAIVNMGVAIKDASQIAMASASNSGESDNTNGQKLLDLQNSKIVGGNKTFNDAYASLVSDIGNKTSTLKVTSTTQSSVVVQLTHQQQSISGVNLDEEYGNLQRFQQYYLANAQVLHTASTLFDALLSIR